MFDAILSGGPGRVQGAKFPGKQEGLGGTRGPPMRGMVGERVGVQSMDFGGWYHLGGWSRLG